MKDSEILYKAAAKMRQHGFDPSYWGDGKSCGCFIAAVDRAIYGKRTHRSRGVNGACVTAVMRDIVGAECYSERELIAAGWGGKDATADAASALEIAADIACAEGR